LVLTKNKSLPADIQMADSITRIKKFPLEVWTVKLADRITNLQPPPSHTGKVKYLDEAKLIYDELKNGNEYFANRLMRCIENYKKITL
jgi:guanosine-3',5'-bis(diphosphate) 3'-pyrophosphohydrolase